MADKKAYAYRDKPEILDRLFGTVGLALIVFLMVSLIFLYWLVIPFHLNGLHHIGFYFGKCLPLFWLAVCFLSMI